MSSEGATGNLGLEGRPTVKGTIFSEPETRARGLRKDLGLLPGARGTPGTEGWNSLGPSQRLGAVVLKLRS